VWLAAAGFAAVATACRTGPTTPGVVPSPGATVKLAVVRATDSVGSQEVTGTLYPEHALQLAFEVPGRLSAVHVSRGQRVKPGDVLGALDAEVARAQVAQAEAAVAVAEAQAQISGDVAERSEKLRLEGSVSDLEGKSTAAQARQTGAQLLAARAQLAQVRAALSRHVLRAPFAGVIIDAPDQVGHTVAAGMPVFTLESLDTLTLRTTVAEDARPLLRVGQRVTVRAVGSPAQTDAGNVRLLLPSADPSTRRVPVEIAVPNQDQRFVAHTLARVRFDVSAARSALAVPASALVSSGGDHLFVVGPDDVVARVPVEVLDRGASEVLVSSGLALNRVVDNPATDLVEGARVSVR
jgi:RND family efflux transporter MFP subunit